MKFKLKITPEVFSTPDRKTFSVSKIEAYPIGEGQLSESGVEQVKFYFSFLGEENVKLAETNANVETLITLPNGTAYPLLSNLFSSDAETKYEAMAVVASSYGYTALPFLEQ